MTAVKEKELENGRFSKKYMSSLGFTQVPNIFWKKFNLLQAGFLSIILAHREHLIQEGKISEFGEFYLTADKAKDYSIKEHTQRKSIEIFNALGILSVEMKLGKKGSKQRFYTIHDEKLKEFLDGDSSSDLRNKNSEMSESELRNLRPENESELRKHSQGIYKKLFKKETNETNSLDSENRDVQDKISSLSEQDISAGLNNLSNTNIESKDKALVNIPKTIQPYIDSWEEFGFRKHGKNSIVLKDSVQILKRMIAGVFFADKSEYNDFEDYRLSLEDFNESLSKFKLCFDDRYKPYNKSKLPQNLKDFLYCPRYKMKSSLIHYLVNEPISIAAKPKDKNPVVTDTLVSEYGSTILGNNDYTPTNQADWNRFEMGSQRLVEFFTQNKKRYNGTALNPHRMATLLIKSVKDSVGDSMQISPGFLCSNKTFEERLPLFLKKNAVIINPVKSISDIENEMNEGRA